MKTKLMAGMIAAVSMAMGADGSQESRDFLRCVKCNQHIPKESLFSTTSEGINQTIFKARRVMPPVERFGARVSGFLFGIPLGVAAVWYAGKFVFWLDEQRSNK